MSKKVNPLDLVKLSVKKSIPHMLSVGQSITIGELKEKFPFLDYNNIEFFEPYTKYKVGDKVIYTGERDFHGLIYKSTLVIEDVSTKWNDRRTKIITTYYCRSLIDKNQTSYFSEEDLSPSVSKWIVSFSNNKSDSRPAVMELDNTGYIKHKEAWKNIFVYDTKEEAEKVAEFFASNTIRQMMNVMGFDIQYGAHVCVPSNDTSINPYTK